MAAIVVAIVILTSAGRQYVASTTSLSFSRSLSCSFYSLLAYIRECIKITFSTIVHYHILDFVCLSVLHRYFCHCWGTHFNTICFHTNRESSYKTTHTHPIYYSLVLLYRQEDHSSNLSVFLSSLLFSICHSTKNQESNC